MVLESMVVDILNKFLGDYVENLDTKQLKIGIWGGNVELRNLQVRENALDDLNLPFQLTHGFLGKLILQIPWKNLYGQPVIADIEDLYVTVSPKQDVQYDEEKELKFELQAKQAHLRKVDEARKLELNQNKEQEDKSFVEKLTAQIINNLQIKIKFVHLRYEDSSNASHPFAMGVTLHSLDIYTTDSNWKKTYINKQVSKVYKVAILNSLSIYMNCNDTIFSRQPKDVIGSLLKDSIASDTQTPKYNHYIIGPISSTAKLVLNTSPELDRPPFEIPKTNLNVEVETLNIGITKTQMQTILKFLDSFNRMKLGAPYRKYKPFNTPYKNNYKVWWKFSITCVLEGIKKKRREWRWDYIREHRRLLVVYASSYKDLELALKPTSTQSQKVRMCEERLDLFNLVLVRNLIGKEIDKIKLKREQEARKSKGWLGGWIRNKKQTEDEESDDAKHEDEEDEKEKLYKAIGYSTSQVDLKVPERFEATKLNFSLGALEIGVFDDTTPAMRTIMKMSLLQVSANLAQRPAANAMKLLAGIKEFIITGISDKDTIEPPHFVKSLLSDDTNLLDIFYETNPIDKSCDQKVKLSSRPLQITYHYETINELMKVYVPEDRKHLSEIEGAASQKMTEYTERSTTGLQYMLENRAIMEIDVNLAPINLLIPSKGLFIEKQCSLIIASLGQLSVKSNPRKVGDITKMVSAGMNKDQILKKVLEYAYDSYNISINDIQLMVAKEGEQWSNNMNQSCDLHIIKPCSLLVDANLCVISNDPRLPKTKVAIVIPKIQISVSEDRLIEALKIYKSLPFPGDDEAQTFPVAIKTSLTSSAMSLISKAESVKITPAPGYSISSQGLEYVQLQISFALYEIKFVFNKDCQKSENYNVNHSNYKQKDMILCFQILELEADASRRAYDTSASARLGAIQLTQYDTLSDQYIEQRIISTPKFTEENQYLLTIKYVMVAKDSPEFRTKHHKTEKLLEVNFSTLKVGLHRELLLKVMRLNAHLQQKINEIPGSPENISVDTIPEKPVNDGTESVVQSSDNFVIDPRTSRGKEALDIISLKLIANLEMFEVDMFTIEGPLASFQMKDLEVGVIMKESCTEIISIIGEEVLQVRVAMFKNQFYQYDPYDMRVSATLGCLRIVYLNLFIVRIQNFNNSFQTSQTSHTDHTAHDAGQTIPETVRQEPEEVNIFKMKLNIHMKAPLIYLPEHSRSFESMQLDLGFLSIESTCTNLEIPKDERSPAVIDDMKIHLKDVKLSIVMLEEDLEVLDKSSTYGNLMDTFTLSIYVQRNLSSTWYKDQPGMNVSGNLDSIVMNLTKSDYQVIMSIWSKNLSEGKDIYGTDGDSGNSGIHAAMKRDTLTSLSEYSYEQMTYYFQFGGVSLNMFMFDESPLARFGIQRFSVKGRSFDSGYSKISVILADMILDDLRPTSEGKLTRFMSRKEDKSEASTDTDAKNNMISLIMRSKPNDSTTELNVSGFDLIICLDFVYKVLDFFASSEDSSPPKRQSITSQQPAEEPVERKLLVMKSEEPEIQNKSKTLLNIEEVDIILVEHLDDMDANTIILNMKTNLVYKTVGESQIMTGKIPDLKMYMCAFNPERREQTKHYVLHPCSITLDETMPNIEGMHIRLRFSKIILNISPATTELLTKTMTTVTPVGEETVKEVKEEADYSHIWTPDSFEDKNYWFLKTRKIKKEVSILEGNEDIRREKCVIELPSILLVFETGFGYYTTPMFNIEFEISTTISNWSSSMCVNGDLSFTMQYYNAKNAAWEPMIEPNEHIKPSGVSEFDTWTLAYSVKMNKTNPDDESSMEAARKVSLISYERLEMTVTRTSLDLLGELGNAFSEAVYSKGLTKPSVIAPYKIENRTGHNLTLDFTKGVYTLHEYHRRKSSIAADPKERLILGANPNTMRSVNDIKYCVVPHGGQAYLQTKIVQDMEEIYVDTIVVRVGDIDKNLILPVKRADQRYFPLTYSKRDPWGVVSEVTTVYGTSTIKVRSVVNIKNHFVSTVSVFQKEEGETVLVGQIPPKSVFNVPLNSVYTDSKELFFSLPGYKPSSAYKWNDYPNLLHYNRYVRCGPIVKNRKHLYINASREKTEILHENSLKYTIFSAYYTIHLRPLLYLKNALPIDLHVSVSGCSGKSGLETEINNDVQIVKEQILDYGEKCIKPGELLQMPIVKIAKTTDDSKCYVIIRLVEYLERLWSCSRQIINSMGFESWTFNSYDSVDIMNMELQVHFENKHGSLCLTIFSPFWMINKTGLMLTYMTNEDSEDVIYHPAEYSGPILFAFPSKKKFLSKNKAFVRVDNGEWSTEMPLNSTGSMGKVSCETNERIYEIGVQNNLTSNSLTKQITFMPFFIIINKCKFVVEVQDSERPTDPWLLLEPGTCSPYWPKGATDSSKNLLKVRVANLITNSFEFNVPQCSLLKLSNSYGGVKVEVQVTEGGVYITMNAYQPGDAPCLFINQTDAAISYSELESNDVNYIHPKTQKLFSWSNTSGTLVEFQDKDAFHSDLKQDGKGQFLMSGNKVYWVSFLDGLQRVIIFSNDKNMALPNMDATSKIKFYDDYEISIQGIGISLANNIKRVDVIYLSITDSGIVWKHKRKGKRFFKQMKTDITVTIEKEYQKYTKDKSLDLQEKYFLDQANKIEIDFENMKYNQRGSVSILRTTKSGVWVSWKTSPEITYLHVKVHRLQIDSQLFDCIFPVVLAPIPPPKSIGDSQVMKPFLEYSAIRRTIPNSNVLQYKYVSMLMQEFHIKVDLMFINAVSEMFTGESTNESDYKQFATDVESIIKPLLDLVSTKSEMEQKHFYDRLHLGPLKIHISFSMAGSENIPLPGLLSVLVQSVGVTLTDVNDIVIKLAFFQREYRFYSRSQVMSEIKAHYSGQFLKQLYVLVLGLDILGNPYGLVVGFTKGATDLFYEPFQGAIQGPGEFAEGLKIGLTSLFSHTIGGTAQAVSKVTGALGKGIAALTCDEDYQRKRRQQSQRKPKTITEGFAQSGKNLATGFYEGITGVVTKPIAGAKEQGVGGFFKGLGKGAMGLVARPAAGVVDFTSDTFDAVKRVTSEGEDANRIRPPRFFASDGIVRPYSLVAAKGQKVFKELEKGKYNSTDIFIHCEEVFWNREYIILTNNRVIYALKNETFSSFGCKWTYLWTECVSILSSERGVFLSTKQESSRKISCGVKHDMHRIISLQSKTKNDYLCQKMNEIKENA